jgi:hypothetical protein
LLTVLIHSQSRKILGTEGLSANRLGFGGEYCVLCCEIPMPEASTFPILPMIYDYRMTKYSGIIQQQDCIRFVPTEKEIQSPSVSAFANLPNRGQLQTRCHR